MIVFFFFQAEDGIRYYKVTGVQTCALPISGGGRGREEGIRDERLRRRDDGARVLRADLADGHARLRGRVRRSGGDVVRSEERRVGKECGAADAAARP